MYDFKYVRKIETLNVEDQVLPPLAFLEHSIGNIRKFVHANNFFKEDGGWMHGKMQLVVGINNTQNNSFTVTPYNDNTENKKAIGPELSFVARPLNVNLMSFNNLITQQKKYIENKLLESQGNGSGWTLHSMSLVQLLLVINPRNISATGLRKLVGGAMNEFKFDMGEWAQKASSSHLILNEAEVNGDNESGDEEAEKGPNEYDVTDKFVIDEPMDSDESSDVSFYRRQNSKRRNFFDSESQEAGPSKKKKSRMEEIINNYEMLDENTLEVADDDADGQAERNNLMKRGREKVITDTVYDFELDDGADLHDFFPKTN